jgi:Zn-dependent protease with chaperone function
MSNLPQPTASGYFDGQTARRHEVTITIAPSGDAVRLTFADGRADMDIPLALLRKGGDQPGRGQGTVFHIHQPGEDEMQRGLARINLPQGELDRWLDANAPNLARRDVPKATYSRLAKAAVFAVVALGVLLFVIIPNLAALLANTISREREVAIGKKVVEQIEYLLAGFDNADLGCETPAGRTALDQMLARMTDTGMITYDIDIRVIDHDMINAFAAPGGQVVILRGLLDAAEGPDEVAGVLAHEIGHVEARDPLREAIRAAGSAGILSMAIGDVTGGALTAVMAEQMLSSAYTRAAEESADSFGLDLLRAAAISPKGLETFFDRIAGMGLEMPEVFSSHPNTESRKEKAAAAGSYEATLSLTDVEWQALKTICE